MMKSLSKEQRGQCCVCSYFRRLMGRQQMQLQGDVSLPEYFEKI